MKVVVIGGGISGLTAAFRLMRDGHDVVCLDPASRPGGVIRSDRHEGFLCETGPQALMGSDDEAVTKLLADLDLGDRVVRAAPAARRRFIYSRGALRELPTGPGALLRSDLFGAGGKLRLLREPFVPRGSSDENNDESIFDFARRRFGRAIAEAIASPAIIGIYAGDAAQLSIRSALPAVFALEAAHGSVLRGFKKTRKRGAPSGTTPLSFIAGLEELPRALAYRLGSRVDRARAVGLVRQGETWTVHFQKESGSGRGTLSVDVVVLATAAQDSATLLSPLAPRAAQILAGVPHAPVAVACLGFKHADLGMDLGAYGFLVARGEKATILGCQYESSIFPARAPEGWTLLRVLLGGVFEPEIVERNDRTIVDKAVNDLRVTAGLKSEPDHAFVVRHTRGIPQYTLGHHARVRELDHELSMHPGLHLIGWSVRGVGLGDCIRGAIRVAEGVSRTSSQSSTAIS